MMSSLLLSSISTFFIVLSAVLVAIGWALVKNKKIEAHKKTMFAAAISALTFFIIYVSRTLFIGIEADVAADEYKI